MQTIKTLWKKPIIKGAVLVLVVFLVAISIRSSSTEEAESTDDQLPSVEVTTAAAIAGQQQITLIGTVRAFSEADITSERAGRVTSVNTTLGSTVAAGQVIATLENSAEQAAVLQAEGAYEAALAAASQSTLSSSEASASETAAENALTNSLRSAYTVTNQIVRNDIDDLFSNPDSNTVGLKLDGGTATARLNNERIAYRNLLTEWNARTSSINSTSLNAEVDYAVTNINRTIDFLDEFLRLFPEQDKGERYSEAELESLTTVFTNNKNTLLNTLASVENAETSLSRARDAAERARTGSTGGSASTADAQVKQALGSLRAAQASLSETILRSPISGRVNNLDISLGDFVSAFSQVAVVANNDALEIVTFAGDLERDQLVEGDTVRIDGVATGTVVTVAPSLDAVTRKTEVRIATDSELINNGDTVRITKESNAVSRVSQVLVPLTAVKFEATDGFIMQVTDEGVVTQKAVALGAIRGNRVEIQTGLAADELFIRDVRGLTPGATVTTRE